MKSVPVRTVRMLASKVVMLNERKKKKRERFFMISVTGVVQV